MSRQYQRGFTIIEVMLFLAITGLLVVTLLTGWTISVNTQSYKDSVRSLSTTLQGQYNNAVQVTNDRDANWTCAGSGGSTTVAVGFGAARGQSNCVIMGRYIYINNGNITSNSIIGLQDAGSPIIATSTDIDSIKNYGPTKIPNDMLADVAQDVPWSAKLYFPGNPTTNAKLAIVIVRSPKTGTVYTFTKANADSPSVQDVLTSGTQDVVTLCVDAEAAVASETLGVMIDASASSQNAVHVVSQDQQGATKC